MIGPAVIADSGRASERIFALSTAYAELCDRLRVPYLDLAQVTHGSKAWMAEALAGDGAHPGRGGYTDVAEAVAQWVAWDAWVKPHARR